MSSVLQVTLAVILELFLAALVIGLVYRVWSWFLPVPKRQFVLAYQRGVLLKEGHVKTILTPGYHWVAPGRSVLLCDMRPKPFQIAGQDALTSDGMAVRVSLGGEYRVVNPASFAMASSDSFGSFYLEIRQALRTSIGEMSGDRFLADESQLTARLKELLIPRAAQLGIEMSQIDLWESVPVGWLRPI